MIGDIAESKWTRRATGSSRLDGPARAVRCAQAIVDAVRTLDIEIRAGVHTGEIETIDQKVGGIAVNMGARVAALASASEVLVSQTVKDLTAGSGLEFEEAGEHELKGVPDRWRVYRAITDTSSSAHWHNDADRCPASRWHRRSRTSRPPRSRLWGAPRQGLPRKVHRVTGACLELA